MQRLLHGCDQLHGEPVFERPPPQVYQLDPRLGGAGGAPRQAQVSVSTTGHVVQALQRRSGRTQHHRHVPSPGAHDGEIPSGVAKPFLLLEREIVLLVHDDDAGAGQGDEDGGARADDHCCPPAARGQPSPHAIAPRERRMQHHHRDAQPGPKSLDHLRREPDLRHQHQGLSTGRDHALDERQIDLGLPAARDTIEQEHVESAQGGLDRLDGSTLRRRRRDRRGPGAGAGRARIEPLCPAPGLKQPQRPAPVPTDFGEHLAARALRRRPQSRPQLSLARGPPEIIRRSISTGRGEAPAVCRRRHRASPVAQTRWQGAQHHLSDRMVEVSACPHQEL